MTDLEQRSEAYALHALELWRKQKTYGIRRLLAEAYSQGWVDRDTRDMKPEIQDDFFNGE